MNTPRVYTDFHSADTSGLLRFGCVGTLQDLSRQQIVLKEGLRLKMYSENLEVRGVSNSQPTKVLDRALAQRGKF